MSSESQQSQASSAAQNVANACVTGAIGGVILPGAGLVAGCIGGAITQAVIESVKPSVAK